MMSPKWLAGLAWTLTAAGSLAAQATPTQPVSAIDQAIRAEGFVTPPGSIAEAVLAPRHLNANLTEINADRTKFLREVGDGPVTMAVFSKPFHELGGLFIDFAANRSRPLTIRSNVGLEIISATDGSRLAVGLPAGLRVTDATWSPDGKSVAFFGHTADATHLWVADASTGRARQVTKTPVLATLATGFEWSDDSKRLVTVLVPESRAAMPERPAAPLGPQVKLAEETDKNRLRNFASLMATPYDQSLLEWHVTGQLALVDVQTRVVTKVGQPTMIERADLSPDGRYLRVVRMVKPFSYLVPVGNFGTVDEVWDVSGKVLAKVGDEPLNLGADTARVAAAPGVGGDNAARGRREVAWRRDGQGLTYLEQEARPNDSTPPDGDSAARPRRKDRVYQWLPPFDSTTSKVLFENDSRLSNVRYSANHQMVFASERVGQNQHEFAVALAEPTKKLTLARFRADDVQANPGSLLLTGGAVQQPNPFGGFGGFGANPGGQVVETTADGNYVYRSGTEYAKDPLVVGPKSFIDKVAIRGGARVRLYESENNGIFERVLAYRDLAAVSLVVSRESETDVPQSYLREGGQLVQLTQNTDPTPDLTRAPRQSFIVERPDGFKFKVNVTLPPGYQPGTKLPAMFWFYPREFSGQDEYDRGARTFNKNAFPAFNARSIQFLARAGYAVVEPDAPIVGPAGQMNNNYEHDLRNNLAAVIVARVSGGSSPAISRGSRSAPV